MKLYLTDLDGTLLDHKAQIGRMTEALMNRLIDDDIKISYATARSVHSAEPKVSCINFRRFYNRPCHKGAYRNAFFQRRIKIVHEVIFL